MEEIRGYGLGDEQQDEPSQKLPAQRFVQ
jgi:hypothetical protein